MLVIRTWYLLKLKGMTEGTNVDEKEKEEDDWIKTCNLIKQINITNPDEIIDKYIE